MYVFDWIIILFIAKSTTPLETFLHLAFYIEMHASYVPFVEGTCSTNTKNNFFHNPRNVKKVHGYQFPKQSMITHFSIIFILVFWE